jgi:hypothetical protein
MCRCLVKVGEGCDMKGCGILATVDLEVQSS